MTTSSGTEREIQLFSLIVVALGVGMGICGLQKNQNQAIAAPPSLTEPSVAAPSLAPPSVASNTVTSDTLYSRRPPSLVIPSLATPLLPPPYHR
jgi:hypothetical protein